MVYKKVGYNEISEEKNPKVGDLVKFVSGNQRMGVKIGAKAVVLKVVKNKNDLYVKWIDIYNSGKRKTQHDGNYSKTDFALIERYKHYDY